MGIRSLESVLKLTSDTSDFEAGMKRAGDATRLLEKNIRNAFNDPLLQAGMKVAGYAIEQMAANSERMRRNASEWSPMAIREQALADVAGMRADITEGRAAGPMAAQAARIERMRAEQRMSNAANPSWASRPGSFWNDPFGYIGRKWDTFNAATDITAQRFEQQTGMPGFLSAFTGSGFRSISELNAAMERGGATPKPVAFDVPGSMTGWSSVGISLGSLLHKWISGGGG
jgi:hypothetical protein